MFLKVRKKVTKNNVKHCIAVYYIVLILIFHVKC